MSDLVIGVDAGGTATRCAVASLDGTIVGTGDAGGANHRSSIGDSAANLHAALATALGDIPPSHVVAGVFGIAGAGAAGYAAAREAADGAWQRLSLPGRPLVVTDIVVAFAAGTSAPAGVVLNAGTGAVAAAIDGTEIVHRCDGYGWLLGDEGSAVWLGREAVRAALAAVDGRGEPTALTRPVMRAVVDNATLVDDALSGSEPTATLVQAVIADVHDSSPAEFGNLAPVLAQASSDGDVVARGITDDAARRLLAAVDAVRTAAPSGSPVVVGGSVLREGPVAESVRSGLVDRGIEPSRAGDGALGAVALALRHAAHPSSSTRGTVSPEPSEPRYRA